MQFSGSNVSDCLRLPDDGCLLRVEVTLPSGLLVGSIVTPSPEHWLKAEDSVPGLFEGSMKGSDVGCLDGCFDGCLLSAEVISSS